MTAGGPRKCRTWEALWPDDLNPRDQTACGRLTRAYRNPSIIDKRIELDDYQGELPQIAITDLGHDQPTLLLTNQLRRSASDLIDHYAKRMLIENSISDGIDFFHMDALSSAVALKVNCDLQLTLMGNSLYCMLGTYIGGSYETAESRHIFRDLVQGSAGIAISKDEFHVQFGKRAHNPLLLGADFAKTPIKVPWWGGRRLTLGGRFPSVCVRVGKIMGTRRSSRMGHFIGPYSHLHAVAQCDECRQ